MADLAGETPAEEDGRTEALELVCSLIERVAVQPAEGGGIGIEIEIEIEIVGELAGMVEIALAPEGGGAKTKRRSGIRNAVR